MCTCTYNPNTNSETQKHRYHLSVLPHSVDFNIPYSHSVFSFSVETILGIEKGLFFYNKSKYILWKVKWNY